MANPDPEGQEESGSSLRAKLEAEVATNRALRSELATTVASGFKYVKPEDLADVEAKEMRQKAEAIEADRKTERDNLLAEVLKERGLQDEQLESVLSTLVPSKEEPKEDDAASRIASLGSLTGTPPQTTSNTEGLFGADRIRAGIASTKKR